MLTLQIWLKNLKKGTHAWSSYRKLHLKVFHVTIVNILSKSRNAICDEVPAVISRSPHFNNTWSHFENHKLMEHAIVSTLKNLWNVILRFS